MTIKMAAPAEVKSKTQASADAEAALAAAVETERATAELVQALEDRIRGGDQTITHDQLAAERSKLRWAKLRAEAAQRQAADAHAQLDRLVHEAAVAEARTLLAANSVESLTGPYGAAVDALVGFVNAYQARIDSLAKAKSLLSGGNAEFDAVPSSKISFEGVQLDVPPTEFVRSVLDVVSLATERVRPPRQHNTPMDSVMDRVDIRGANSAVRTLTEGL